MTDGRLASVLDAAARVFAARGYEHATLEDIAAASGLTVPDVTAIAPDKYGLFSAAVLRATSIVEQATASFEGEVHSSGEARAQLAAVVDASARATIRQRTGGGFFRAEVRNLTDEDRARNRATMTQVQSRIRRPLAIMRPTLGADELALLTTAAQSCIASITIHHTDMAEGKILTLLTASAMRVLSSSLPTADEVTPTPPSTLPWRSDDSPRGRLQRAGQQLLAERGFAAVTAHDVAEAAGLPASALKAEFESVLGLALDTWRTGYEELMRANASIVSAAATPRQALAGLCRNYVLRSFEEPHGMTAFLNEGRRLDGDLLAEMLHMQGDIVRDWVRALSGIRPELSKPELRFLVFAGMCIVNDCGRVLEWRRDPLNEARIERAVLAAMANLRP